MHIWQNYEVDTEVAEAWPIVLLAMGSRCKHGEGRATNILNVKVKCVILVLRSQLLAQSVAPCRGSIWGIPGHAIHT